MSKLLRMTQYDELAMSVDIENRGKFLREALGFVGRALEADVAFKASRLTMPTNAKQEPGDRKAISFLQPKGLLKVEA